MSLQVKLKHPLGEKLVELEPHPAEDPLVIGRQVGAAIQVPSVSVSPRHSLLFVHDGRWVVQDSGETTGTFVNGQPIEGAVFLQVGDVIKLGAEPRSPTITIDPLGPGEGRRGYALASPGAVRAAVPPPTAGRGGAARLGGNARPVYGVGAAAMAPPPQPPPATGYSDEQGGGGDDIAWPTEGTSSASAGTSKPMHSRAKKSNSEMPIMIAIGVGIVIVIGTIWIVYSKMHTEETHVAAGPQKSTSALTAKKPSRDNAHASGSIFDADLIDRSTASASPSAPTAKQLPIIKGNPVEIAVSFGPGKRDVTPPAGNARQTAAADGNEKSEPPVIDENDPRFKTPEWKRLDTASHLPDYLGALLAYEDYERDHPGELTAQVNQLREVTLDLLWFSHIEQLWRKRETFADSVRKLDENLRDEPNEAFRNGTLIPEKQAAQKRLNAVSETIVKEMGYTADSPPDVTDDAQLEQLRKLRDPDYYAQWKKRVINTVHRQRTLPWGD